MLVGLACSGKTKWAKDFIKNNPEKHYNILGTSTAVERALKDQSILNPAQKSPRVFESFFMKAGKFVERLVDIAPSRKRNYILDQVRLKYSRTHKNRVTNYFKSQSRLIHIYKKKIFKKTVHLFIKVK